MKKRKFPAGLIVALVVLVGGAGAYSALNTKAANLTPDQAAQMAAEQEAEAARQRSGANAAPSKDAVRAGVKANMKPEGESRGGPPGGPQGGPQAAPGSSIMAPKVPKYKPTPNESATSSQWYSPR